MKTSSQSDANAVEKKRAGKGVPPPPGPEHSQPVREVHTMPADGQYSDSASPRKTDDKGDWKPLSELVRQIVKNVTDKRNEGQGK